MQGCLDKDAVIARLQGELNRMKQREAQQSQANAALQAQVEAFQHSALATDRASAQAAMAAPDALQKHLTGLQALLECKEQQVAQLQAEAEAAARSHTDRMTELQESCHRKVHQVRADLERQLAAAHTSAAAVLAEQAAPAAAAAAAGEIQALQAHLARAQEAADKQAVQCQQEVAATQRQRTSLAAELATSEARNQQLSGQLLQLRRDCQELQQCRVSAASAQAWGHQAAAGGNEDAERSQQHVQPEVLELMEGQLGRLSAIIREKEAAVAMLQQTVQQECNERMHLLQQLQRLGIAKPNDCQADLASGQSSSGIGGASAAQPTDKQSGLPNGKKAASAAVGRQSTHHRVAATMGVPRGMSRSISAG